MNKNSLPTEALTESGTERLSGGAPVTVLVADDEAGMRAGVARILRNYSVCVPDVEQRITFEVLLAETGEEALERIEQCPPNILLLDHKMPGVSGLEVLARVAGLETEMLTIMITAYASLETAVTATRQGAYDFLAKPFTPDELRNTIRKATVRIALTRQVHRLAEENRMLRYQFARLLGHGRLEGIQKLMDAPYTGLTRVEDQLEQETSTTVALHKPNVDSHGSPANTPPT